MSFPERRRQTASESLSRYGLPYGVYINETEEVLFNRGYQPIWRRREIALGYWDSAEQANPGEWIKYKEQLWFYDDSCPPDRNAKSRIRCLRVLNNFFSGKSIRQIAKRFVDGT
jgi:hypothetical protein